MNRFNTSCGEDKKKYRRIKRYWKLLLKNEDNLSYTEYKYYAMFGQRLEVSIVDEILNYDDELKANYKLYQSLLRVMTNRDFEALKKTLKESSMKHISTYMRTSLKTLRKHFPYIKNSFLYPYNNGRIEGINNKIKVLNRVAYGYRNFENFKNRIMLHFKYRSFVDKSKQKETHSQVA